jgi:ribosomal protein S18 acetylase RimI-like enzyme
MIVGVSLIQLMASPDDSIFRPRRYGYLDEIAVLERCRGQGIGQMLMNAVHQWARAHGVDQIELQVWRGNQGAIQFYKKLGYMITRHTMQLALGEGRA